MASLLGSNYNLTKATFSICTCTCMCEYPYHIKTSLNTPSVSIHANDHYQEQFTHIIHTCSGLGYAHTIQLQIYGNKAYVWYLYLFFCLVLFYFFKNIFHIFSSWDFRYRENTYAYKSKLSKTLLFFIATLQGDR